MKEFVALLPKEKGKTAVNEWKNGESDIIWALYSVYKKARAILFPYFLVNLFKLRYVNSGKSYKYLDKFII